MGYCIAYLHLSFIVLSLLAVTNFSILSNQMNSPGVTVPFNMRSIGGLSSEILA